MSSEACNYEIRLSRVENLSLRTSPTQGELRRSTGQCRIRLLWSFYGHCGGCFRDFPSCQATTQARGASPGRRSTPPTVGRHPPPV